MDHLTAHAAPAHAAHADPAHAAHADPAHAAHADPAPTVPRQARAIRTRDAIIGAAVSCAVRAGVASSSTAKVAAEAGVSQGALFRYFPHRATLWAHAVERVLAELFDDAVAELRAAADAQDPVAEAVSGLWRVFTDDRLFVAFELFAEARTHEALRAALAPVIAAHTEREVALAAALFPNAGHQLEPVVLGILSTLQGAAVSSRTVMRAGSDPVELAFIETVVRDTLGDLDLAAIADTLSATRSTAHGAVP